MNRMFGTDKQQQSAPAQQKPIQQPQQKQATQPVDLNTQQQRFDAKSKELENTIKGIEKEVAECYVKVKQSKGTSQQMYKQRCMQLLKKKKMYEQQLQQVMQNQLTLDQMAFTKQNIQNQIEMSQAMKQAHQEQQKAFQQVDMDELEDIKDQMDEMNYDQEYMNQMMNRNYQLDVDEAELDAEMQEIEDDLYQDVLKNGGQKQQMKQQAPQYYSNAMQSQKQPQQNLNQN